VSEVPAISTIRTQRSDDEFQAADRVALKLAGGALAAMLVLAVPRATLAGGGAITPNYKDADSARSSRR